MVPQHDHPTAAVMRRSSFFGIEVDSLMEILGLNTVMDSLNASKQSPLPDCTSSTRLIALESMRESIATAKATETETPSPTRKTPLRRRSSVRFLPDVSVLCLEDSVEERKCMYYSKEEIQTFKENKKQEEDLQLQKAAERLLLEKKQAKRRVKEARKKKVADRRASRSQDLLFMTDALHTARIKRNNSTKNLLGNFLDKDKQSPLERAEEARDAFSVF